VDGGALPSEPREEQKKPFDRPAVFGTTKIGGQAFKAGAGIRFCIRSQPEPQAKTPTAKPAVLRAGNAVFVTALPAGGRIEGRDGCSPDPQILGVGARFPQKIRPNQPIEGRAKKGQTKPGHHEPAGTCLQGYRPHGAKGVFIDGKKTAFEADGGQAKHGWTIATPRRRLKKRDLQGRARARVETQIKKRLKGFAERFDGELFCNLELEKKNKRLPTAPTNVRGSARCRPVNGGGLVCRVVFSLASPFVIVMLIG